MCIRVRSRIGKCVRNTSETQIEISINLDGSGKSNIHTGIGFFDHMLISFAKHGFFDLDVKVNGDLYVDCHHTIEDTGIALGMAIKEALGDKKSIKRYGNMILPCLLYTSYLKRLEMGPLVLDDDLASGEYRELSEDEINFLLKHKDN